MELCDATAALAALAQETRLRCFRLLVRAGQKGVAASEPDAALRAFRRTACALATRVGGLLALLGGHPPGTALPAATVASMQRLGDLPV